MPPVLFLFISSLFISPLIAHKCWKFISSLIVKGLLCFHMNFRIAFFSFLNLDSISPHTVVSDVVVSFRCSSQ